MPLTLTLADGASIVPDMPEAEYHAHPALSSTNARLILESPARLRYRMDHPQPQKDAFDLGTAVHSKVLGVGYDVAVLDFPDFRTKAAREARDEARAAGKIVISPGQMDTADAMAEAILAHPTARQLLEQGGQAEASAFATDPVTGVDLRARFDYFAPICVDVKTTGREASAAGFSKAVADHGYDVQQAHYLDTLQIATGERRQMVFVVVESEAPHLVAVHQLDREFDDMGRVKAKRAREIFAACSAADIWPGYPSEIGFVIPPMYAVYQFQDRFES